MTGHMTGDARRRLEESNARLEAQESTHTAQVVRVLSEHIYLLDTTACTCGKWAWVWVEHGNFFADHRTHVADALTAAGIGVVADANAEALREAADDYNPASEHQARGWVQGWLIDRAARIESEAGQ